MGIFQFISGAEQRWYVLYVHMCLWHNVDVYMTDVCLREFC